MKEMFEHFKKTIKDLIQDDGIDIGPRYNVRYHIRCFSPMWWVIRILEAIAILAVVFGFLYIFYIGLWLLMH